MTVELITPEGMFQPVPYHHVAIGTGSRLIQMAGQVARDGAGGHVATGDLAGQIAHVLRSAGRGLAGAGATFADVTRLRFYIVDWSPAKSAAFGAGLAAVAAELALPEPLPPITLIGVQALFEPDALVELEVDAVLA
ncbi:hypothetical protein GCM10027515_09790 [Schumannella luteola]|uniref:Enamine deaminase RidA (YjgF/YER057c/UK114 family) n=1 Tax=Schumannella luteola TaxID=472059 RepID=A0A852YCV3_9MICO|nr:Rid family hydrolase [Schumannella luteola]NYG97427.1 enamine deaminase RidA (YjgF/YER057c/UK114 family) [Schumannella luteola]TPX01671.1 RidA family protein [Schumannella luteola]